ncbi:phage holin family protein [Flavobacterium oreochromis]|uniref:phage holin family protein n=1 Tax=Flavobacterium oreochromis TaxID=2906078 RepID=UPI00385CC26A
MINKANYYINEVKILLYGVVLYLDLDIEIVKVLFFLMVIDTFLGIIKAIVLNNIFSFKKLALGFVSKLAILLIPVALALMSKGLNYDFKWFVTIVIDLLIVSDGISIFSNIIAIKTKKEIENFDALTQLLKAIRNLLIRFFKKLLKSLDTYKVP